ncbi:MAG: PKD domain-containing protein [Acidimicrobiia bacterium]|nr:PKD domain-containing protein [Acidimicrobiia bacterium]
MRPGTLVSRAAGCPRPRRRATGVLAVLAGTLVTACGLADPALTPLTGPSEFGLSVTVVARPDQLPRDGSSRSSVVIDVRDAAVRPVGGQRLTVRASIGTLSREEVVTDGAGQAVVDYVAPPVSAVVPGDRAHIRVTPLGGDAEGAIERVVSVSLTGPANRTAPAPAFTVLPPVATPGQAVRFDAAETTDEGTACGASCTYEWDFEGEARAAGVVATHRFGRARTYVVTLRVTDPTGAAASVSAAVTIVPPPPPVPAFTFSPGVPSAEQVVRFNATGSAAAPGHALTAYRWDFGDGGVDSGVTVTHRYAHAGNYVASLTVTDDAGQSRTHGATLTVGAGIAAGFSVSPANPVVGQMVRVHGADSMTSAGATIVEYLWDFGNGQTATRGGPDASTSYETPGTYTIRLTLRDSLGRVATTTRPVTVSRDD